MCGLQFDGEPLETGVEHLFRDNVLYAAGDDVEQPLADVVLPDDEGDFADGDAGRAARDNGLAGYIGQGCGHGGSGRGATGHRRSGGGACGISLADDRAEVPALFLGEEGGVQFRNDGVAAVGVHYPHERVNAAGLVLGVGTSVTVAEVEDLAAEAVALFQYPQPVGCQAVGRNLAQCVQFVGRGDIGREFLIVQWYFQQAFLLQRGGEDSHVYLRRQQFLDNEACAHL